MVSKINWCHAIGQSGLDRTTKCVAFALGAHMNSAGEAASESGGPSQARIADYASCSVRQVYREIKTLEDERYLLVERRDRRRANYFAAVPLSDTVKSDNSGHSSVRYLSDKSRGHSRKSMATAMSTEIHKSQNNGVADSPSGAAKRWLKTGGQSKNADEQKNMLVDYYGLSEQDSEVLLSE
jgi:hypothetical protein